VFRATKGGRAIAFADVSKKVAKPAKLRILSGVLHAGCIVFLHRGDYPDRARRKPAWRRCTMRTLTIVASVFCLGLANIAVAEENPDGTWKWTTNFQNQQREQTLKLKHDGDKLTGSMSGRQGNETKIDEGGTWKDGEVSFSVTRERNGNKFTTKYKGKVSGDTIKGKVTNTRNGQERERDWEAKRST
jgi:hypothetical protein